MKKSPLTALGAAALLVASFCAATPTATATAPKTGTDTDAVREPNYEFGPVRLADTRDSGTGAPVPGGTDLSVNLPVDENTPVGTIFGINITAVSPQGPGWLSAYTGDTWPETSTVNYAGGDIVAGMVYLPYDGSPTIKVRTLATSHIVVDAVSVIEPTELTGTAQRRAHDSRENATTTPHYTADAPLRVEVGGVGAVPADAKAAIVNLTITEPAADGYLELNPTAGSAGATSAVNYRAGQTIANNAIVPLTADGSFTLATMTASHVVVDIVGYVPASATAVIMPGKRIVDTRETTPAWVINDQDRSDTPARDLANTDNRAIRTSGSDLAAAFGMPTERIAGVIANITITGPDRDGYASIWDGYDYFNSNADEFSYPESDITSIANFTAGQNVANGAVIPLDHLSQFNLFTRANANVIVDVTGYIPATPATVTAEWGKHAGWPGAELPSTPVMRTAKPLVVNSASTVVLKASSGNQFEPREQTEGFSGCFTSPGGLRNMAPNDGYAAGTPQYVAANIAINESGDTATITAPADQEGTITCRINEVASPLPTDGSSATAVTTHVVDFRFDATAPAGDVVYNESTLVNESAYAVETGSEIGPGATINVTGAPAGTFSAATEVALRTGYDYGYPAWWQPQVSAPGYAFTQAKPLMGNADTLKVADDGTAMTLTLPNDPAAYGEFLSRNRFGYSPVIYTKTTDGSGDYQAMVFDVPFGR